ncbi:MAG: hypothetical protein ACD_17C00078G0005 [uncultured bacterium]|nr:MAG: hypothetical protein ACD_17C00078G0005 [uncultured bacterium]OGN56445.1 MAG: signal peptidase I [Chlamydiae bacterium RIFCSPHIGHO2_01_FULL_44_39]OGN57135.1 MAG: signal peptidase I [Chlamydiae bacterium RIFCSPHIGHO2_02_FULL_45_9]OGN60163.1 MAG: signal peptidase I [Chlamydiae bacterium RIFCSPHIGHO2_12_FULL_44_59]OGN67184.1 MAG: signal peptidase I [Chlamydiae bacterium RIFCSPLOWO2_01_FULL_44_52]OGN67774.1 MAG: signal peptidase I [Chlamydiae bacterium RIFCSPLOWO2_02_FULL_45_22]OGN71477.1 
MMESFFSLRKSKRTFRLIHQRYKKKARGLDEYTKESIQAYLKELQSAILAKDARKAKERAQALAEAAAKYMPKSGFDWAKNYIGSLLVSLVVAVLVRTMWFELYTIPTGSMRPTLKEDDYLIVSKTDYGINVPLQEAHVYFDPDLVQRGSIIVFNGANMDIADAETLYFYLFPGIKQFVKRLIGKPGDTIYFYGGDLYGIDKDGNEICELNGTPWFNELEYIPFIRFSGKVETPNTAKNGIFDTAIFHQMNQPVAKLNVSSLGTIYGEMIGQGKRDHYFDLWGIKHFAMSRLLTQEELEAIHPQTKVDKGALYLELSHHPTLQGGELTTDEYNRVRPELRTSVSIIPLQKEHLARISQAMTTCKFKIKNQMAWRFGWEPKGLGKYLPKFNVPDGTYEIQKGIVYQLPFPSIPLVGFFTNGFTKKVAANHPLYSSDPPMIHRLYNLGIEFMNPYMPKQKNQKAIPSRYAYFKHGDLYLMGAPILFKEEPAMKFFIEGENQKGALGSARLPYYSFVDAGVPTKEEILANGIRVPDKMYLVLGDNHAMSGDSRQFGFVPENNLKGGVSLLFGPIDQRLGAPLQPAQPHATFPNLTIWAIFLLSVAGTSYYRRKKLQTPYR